MSRETEQVLALAVGLTLFFLAVRMWGGVELPLTSSTDSNNLVPQMVP